MNYKITTQRTGKRHYFQEMVAKDLVNKTKHNQRTILQFEIAMLEYFVLDVQYQYWQDYIDKIPESEMNAGMIEGNKMWITNYKYLNKSLFCRFDDRAKQLTGDLMENFYDCLIDDITRFRLAIYDSMRGFVPDDKLQIASVCVVCNKLVEFAQSNHGDAFKTHSGNPAKDLTIDKIRKGICWFGNAYATIPSGDQIPKKKQDAINGLADTISRNIVKWFDNPEGLFYRTFYQNKDA